MKNNYLNISNNFWKIKDNLIIKVALTWFNFYYEIDTSSVILFLERFKTVMLVLWIIPYKTYWMSLSLKLLFSKSSSFNCNCFFWICWPISLQPISPILFEFKFNWIRFMLMFCNKQLALFLVIRFLLNWRDLMSSMYPTP